MRIKQEVELITMGDERIEGVWKQFTVNYVIIETKEKDVLVPWGQVKYMLSDIVGDVA